MVHVKHMGYELELDHAQIVAALVFAPEHLRESVLKHIAPKNLQLAVRDTLEILREVR